MINIWQWARAWCFERNNSSENAPTDPEVLEFLDEMSERAIRVLGGSENQGHPTLCRVLGLQGGPGRGSELEELRRADRSYHASLVFRVYRDHAGASAIAAWDAAGEQIGSKNLAHTRKLVNDQTVRAILWSSEDLAYRTARELLKRHFDFEFEPGETIQGALDRFRRIPPSERPLRSANSEADSSTK